MRNRILVIKLTDNNYLLWKFQVLTTIQGLCLLKYIKGAEEPTSQFLNQTTQECSSSEINPAYDSWVQQDKILSSWLLGSMTEDILVQMVE